MYIIYHHFLHYRG